MHIFNHIGEDLQQVQQILRKNFNFRAGHLNEFVPLSLSYLDMNLRPGIVINAARLFKPLTAQTIALAAVLQFIFMASRVHSGVKESLPAKERPLDNRSGFQYPVLVGDYLYGKFFTTLCEYEIVRYLNSLAELICQINKSGIQELRNPGLELTDKHLFTDVVRGETAELFARSAYLGADVAGADDTDKNNLYRLGYNLGMAYGLLERGATQNQIGDYITTAELVLLRLPPGPEFNFFKDLLALFTRGGSVQRLVG